MRIGCLQFAPVKGDVNNNLSRADAVLLKDNPEDLDILVLPELAFTGYHFKSLTEIFPHLEPTGSGTSSLWARTVALKYDCTVVVGYPEKVDVSHKWPASPEYYNSAIVVDGEGQTVGSYRKTHLSTDETWALEGQGGFFNGDIAGVKNATIGISTDIAPYRSNNLSGSFEFANRVVQVRSNLVIVSLACPTNQERRLFSRSPHEPDMDTLMHWVSRLEPIIHRDDEEEVIVVFANRAGTEDDVVYAGTSAILGLKKGEVNVYGILGRSDRELLVVDTEKEPWGKLVYRPGAGGVPSAHPQRFYSTTAVPESSASLPDTRARVETPVTPPNASSISEVLRADSLPEPPASGTMPKARGQPKLSLNTSPDALEPMFTNILTPTGPSPTPFSRRPRLTVQPTESWTKRYIDAHMMSPIRHHPMSPIRHHAMQPIPPPPQILGGEVAILQSPLYSATGGPPMHPWDLPKDFPCMRKGDLSPSHSVSTDFTGLSSTKDSGSLAPTQKYDAQSGSNASARRQTPIPIQNVFIERLSSHATNVAPVHEMEGVVEDVQLPSLSEVAGRLRDTPPTSKKRPASVVRDLEKAALQQEQPAFAAPMLLPMTYSAAPKAQRIGELSQSNLALVRSPSCHEAPQRERRANAVGNSSARFRSETRVGAERGRSPAGPFLPATTYSRLTTAPPKKARDQSRGRSRTHRSKGVGGSQTPRPSSRQNSHQAPKSSSRQGVRDMPRSSSVQDVLEMPRSSSRRDVCEEPRPSSSQDVRPTPRSSSRRDVREIPRSSSQDVRPTPRSSSRQDAHETPRPLSRRMHRSTSAGPIDLSQFRVIEERPSKDCAIHGSRSRSASQDQLPRQKIDSPVIPYPRQNPDSPIIPYNRPASSKRQRTQMRHTPIKSNLNNTSNVEKAPSSALKIATQLSAGVFNSALPAGSLPPSPEDPTSPEAQTPSHALPPLSLSNTMFQFSWNQDRKSWVESWLPTLSVSDQTDSSVSSLPSPRTPVHHFPQPPRSPIHHFPQSPRTPTHHFQQSPKTPTHHFQQSPRTPTFHPSTPRAMITAHTPREASNDTLSFVKTLQSMAAAPEFTQAW